jgi:hypothetical protein
MTTPQPPLTLRAVTRHRLGDAYLFDTASGTPLEAYFSGDYVQAHDALRADRYGDKGSIPVTDKAVVKLSVMGGCPFRCRPCDAGSAGYFGDATAEEMVAQFDHIVSDQNLTECSKVKLHLSKLGEPSLNWAPSAAALRTIIDRYPHLGILPTVTTLPRTRGDLAPLVADMLTMPVLSQTKFTLGATDEAKRRSLFGVVLPVADILDTLAEAWPTRSAQHRITLTLLAVPDQPIDAEWLLERIPAPLRTAVTVELYKVNKTDSAMRHGLTGVLQRYQDSGPYEAAMATLRAAGVSTYFSAPSDGEQRALVANGSSLLLQQTIGVRTA